MRLVMRYSLRSFVATALLAGVAAIAVPALAATHHSRTVKVGDYFFVKDSNHTPTVHVARNTLMRWKFVGFEDHNVTVIRGPAKFHSRDMDHGIFRHLMRKRGTYLIECTIHGFKMRLIVGRS
jgi:plastocyanin